MPHVKAVKCDCCCGKAPATTRTCWYCALALPRSYIRHARQILAGKVCCSIERRREIRDAARRDVLAFTKRFRFN